MAVSARIAVVLLPCSLPPAPRRSSHRDLTVRPHRQRRLCSARRRGRSPGNAAVSDDSVRRRCTPLGSPTQYLRATGFGFSVPVGAVIDGIEVDVEHVSSAGMIVDARARIVKSGVIGASEHALRRGVAEDRRRGHVRRAMPTCGEKCGPSPTSTAPPPASRCRQTDSVDAGIRRCDLDHGLLLALRRQSGRPERGLRRRQYAERRLLLVDLPVRGAAARAPTAISCNGDETCDGAGTCEDGPPLDCDDSNICTQDSCDPQDGCLNATRRRAAAARL